MKGKKAFKASKEDILEFSRKVHMAIYELQEKIGRTPRARKAMESLLIVEIFSHLSRWPRFNFNLGVLNKHDLDYCLSYIRKMGLDITTIEDGQNAAKV